MVMAIAMAITIPHATAATIARTHADRFLISKSISATRVGRNKTNPNNQFAGGVVM
jgi:hypothetical protein